MSNNLPTVLFGFNMSNKTNQMSIHQSPGSCSNQLAYSLPHVLPEDFGARVEKCKGGSLKRFQGKINPIIRDEADRRREEGKRMLTCLAPIMHFLTLTIAFQRN